MHADSVAEEESQTASAACETAFPAMEVDAGHPAVPSTSKWVASASMGPTNGPPSLAEFYSDLESRIEASLASLAHHRGSTDDFASDGVLREAFERVWSGIERPEGNETWKIEAVDRALEAAVLRRVRQLSGLAHIAV